MAKNVIIGQSGGPTAVINSSLAGVYKAACSGGRGIVRTLCALFLNGGEGVGYQQNCDHCAQKAQLAADGAVPCPARCRMIFV